ncbi:MAG: DUF2889 domain-containing protein [Nocardioides sp.]|uniref:DUF2889 domain-containing protein n=1 Tax=Nocardioides sp. TaxID=35761 RepID=UPI0039E6B7FC
MRIATSAGPAVLGPAGAAPARRPGSIRRTSTIDCSWPSGTGAETVLEGRARDLVTLDDGRTRSLGDARLDVVTGRDKRIVSIASMPVLPGLADLVESHSISGYRAGLAAAAPAEVGAATLLHSLLDDIPGASLVSRYAITRWGGAAPTGDPVRGADRPRRSVVGVCTGFQPGSSAINEDGTARLPSAEVEVAEIDAGDDLLAWHPLVEVAGPSMRRSRRTDVRVEDGRIRVEAFYQDSCLVPDGSRRGLHEYTLTATVDLRTGELLELTPQPRVLPHGECPLAVLQVGRLVGTPVADLRRRVSRELRGTAGCTHLNDTVRALADVPVLAATALSALDS